MKRFICVCLIVFCFAGILVAETEEKYPMPCGLEFGMSHNMAMVELIGWDFSPTDKDCLIYGVHKYRMIDYGAKCWCIQLICNDDDNLIGCMVYCKADGGEKALEWWYDNYYSTHDTPVTYKTATKDDTFVMAFLWE